MMDVYVISIKDIYLSIYHGYTLIQASTSYIISAVGIISYDEVMVMLLQLLLLIMRMIMMMLSHLSA